MAACTRAIGRVSQARRGDGTYDHVAPCMARGRRYGECVLGPNCGLRRNIVSGQFELYPVPLEDAFVAERKAHTDSRGFLERFFARAIWPICSMGVLSVRSIAP